MYKQPVLNEVVFIEKMASSPPKKIPTSVNFALGGAASCTSWLFVHPFDVIKVRMQLSTEGGAKGMSNG